jgi:hypothetical protein
MRDARFALFSSSLVTFAVGLTLLSGCAMAMNAKAVRGSGTAKTEDREVEKFDRVNVRGSGEVNITVGETQRVTVTGDDNIVPIITTTVKDGELIIEPTESISPRTKLRFEITVARLRGASIAGSGSVNAEGVNEDEIRLAISGSGDITVRGTTKKLTGAIAGSGSMHLADLTATDASVRISGSGDVTVNASESLEVSIAGSGDVRYLGQPRSVQRHVSGSGSVKPAS